MLILRAGLWAGLLAILCGACTVTARTEPHCAGGYWMEGHRGPHGRWHEGHWRCPGGVEVIEVD